MINNFSSAVEIKMAVSLIFNMLEYEGGNILVGLDVTSNRCRNVGIYPVTLHLTILDRL
jgi:hypothetical protein